MAAVGRGEADAAGLEDARQLGQPRVLRSLVEVREERDGVARVESTIRMPRGWRGVVGFEASHIAQVLARPIDLLAVDVAAADSAGWCFFFQAEDGIRDWSVTGVQTCALPI